MKRVPNTKISNVLGKFRILAKNGSHDGITDETHVAESQHEAVNTAVGHLDGQVARKQEPGTDQHHISGKTYYKKRQDQSLVGERVAHHRRKYQTGTRHVDDQSRKLAVEIRVHHFLLTQIITDDYQDEQDNHLRNDCLHCFLLTLKKVAQRYGLSHSGIHPQEFFSSGEPINCVPLRHKRKETYR